jgi:hypothetical protein
MWSARAARLFNGSCVCLPFLETGADMYINWAAHSSNDMLTHDYHGGAVLNLQVRGTWCMYLLPAAPCMLHQHHRQLCGYYLVLPVAISMRQYCTAWRLDAGHCKTHVRQGTEKARNQSRPVCSSHQDSKVTSCASGS